MRAAFEHYLAFPMQIGSIARAEAKKFKAFKQRSFAALAFKLVVFKVMPLKMTIQ